MEIKTLWLADSRRHKGSLTGIFILMLLVSLSLISVLTVWRNSGAYVRQEMERLGYGDITAWVSGVPEIDMLTKELHTLPSVEKTGIQQLVFSEYEVNGQKSDSEGQLVTYEPDSYSYRIFSDALEEYETEDVCINQGEIYVSPSLQSMYGVAIGDTISFPIARNGRNQTFTVKGWFEDPFMGSTMIGMKSFLICSKDHEEIVSIIQESGIDALARDGYMLHIFKAAAEEMDTAAFGAVLNRDTQLLQYTEFSHSDNAIYGFMMTLQNVFTGLLMAFVLILVFVSLVVIGHSISSSLEQDMTDIGILKTLGFTTRKLQKIRMRFYMAPVLLGMILGVLGAAPVSVFISRMTMTTTGLLLSVKLPFTICLPALLLIYAIVMLFVYLKTAQIENITPMMAIRGKEDGGSIGKNARIPIHKHGLCFRLALRQIMTGKRRYLGAFLVAMLLVFFTSVIGRMDSWLGADGKGLMDAFNPADLHIAAQPMGETTMEDIEQTIRTYTEITDRYMLAMPGVSVEGVPYTANVITEPERFHMLQGKTCMEADEIVLTEFAAADLNVSIGDSVSVSTGTYSKEYRISGIYQCANDMGANVGLSREGYGKIGQETPNMWCVHYFLEDVHMQPQIMQALETAYGGDVYLHENSWPGLFGILSAMELLMYFMYGIALIVILIITALTASRLLTMEKKDMGIYRSFGFSFMKLRISFALRFAVVSFLGAMAGILASALFSDILIAALLRLYGISNFSSTPTVGAVLFPAAVVIGVFTVFAWLTAYKIKINK